MEKRQQHVPEDSGPAEQVVGVTGSQESFWDQALIQTDWKWTIAYFFSKREHFALNFNWQNEEKGCKQRLFNIKYSNNQLKICLFNQFFALSHKFKKRL